MVSAFLLALLSMAPKDTIILGATLSLEPLNALTNEWTEASSVLLSRLFTIDFEGRLMGDLAENHEIGEGGLVWRLRLRRGVTWHDGAPFTSADVLYTFDVMRRESTRFGRWRNVSVIDRVEAPESHLVLFRLKAPQPELAVPLAEIPVLPRHRLAGADINDDTAFDRNPVGTGAYRLVGRPRAGEMVLEAHEGYHLGRPRVPRLVLRHIANDEERARAVLSGEADAAHIKPQHAALFRGNEDAVVHRYRTGIWRSLVLNLRRPHLQDRRVREAISLVLDRKAMVAAGLEGFGSEAYSPIPPINWAYPGDRSPREPDPARALELLAGRKLALDLAVWWDEPFRRAASEILQKSLKEIGVDVRFVKVDGERYERIAADLGTEYDGIISGYSGLHDPGDNLAKKYRTGGSQNAGGYSNPELDRLLDEARTLGDRERARELYLRALEIIERDCARIPLAYVDYVFAARRDLEGMENGVLDIYYHFPRFAHRLSFER
jgi:peptide/nickel transport system substrate-binding protein